MVYVRFYLVIRCCVGLIAVDRGMTLQFGEVLVKALDVLSLDLTREAFHVVAQSAWSEGNEPELEELMFEDRF